MAEPGDHAQEDRKRKKHCNRHTSQQVQGLEDFFKMCPHPDEVQRMALSKELGLESKQIKFWFQNKRTQSRTQQGRQDNSTLRADNDRMRTENIVYTEALKHTVCPTCGPKTTEDCFLEQQRLRMDNLRLREEIDLISNMAEKYLGRPITELAPLEPFPASSLELPVGGLGTQGLGPSLDLDLVPGNYPSAMPFPLSVVVPENEKSTMVETATSAMKDLIRLVQNDESLWLKEGSDGREVLHLETYYEIFPRLAHQFKSPDIAIEASRVSGFVMMNTMALVDIFMDASKWADLFSTIVSQARTIDVLSTGIPGSMDGYLALMHAELQVLSPVVPTREFFFLRYCQKIKQDMWAIADVSFISGEDKLDSPSGSRRLPSGCVIRDLGNGYSKVTWVEHMAIKHKNPIHQLFRVLVHSGEAFGAHRWLSTLQRMCERIVAMAETSVGGKRIVTMAETSVGGIRGGNALIP